MRLDYYLNCGLLFPRQRPSAGTPSSARRLAGAVFIAALALSLRHLQGREILGSFRSARTSKAQVYTLCSATSALGTSRVKPTEALSTRLGLLRSQSRGRRSLASATRRLPLLTTPLSLSEGQ